MLLIVGVVRDGLIPSSAKKTRMLSDATQLGGKARVDMFSRRIGSRQERNGTHKAAGNIGYSFQQSPEPEDRLRKRGSRWLAIGYHVPRDRRDLT